MLQTAEGEGTNAVTGAVGKEKTVVWRWQERFMNEGVAGLTRDKTRPSRIRRCCLSHSTACHNTTPSRQSSETKHFRGGDEGYAMRTICLILTTRRPILWAWKEKPVNKCPSRN